MFCENEPVGIANTVKKHPERWEDASLEVKIDLARRLLENSDKKSKIALGMVAASIAGDIAKHPKTLPTLEAGLMLAPVVGDFAAAIESVTGRGLITKKELTAGQRWRRGFSAAIPFLPNGFASLGIRLIDVVVNGHEVVQVVREQPPVEPGKAA